MFIIGLWMSPLREHRSSLWIIQIRGTGYNPPENAAGTNSLTCFLKHGGVWDRFDLPDDRPLPTVGKLLTRYSTYPLLWIIFTLGLTLKLRTKVRCYKIIFESSRYLLYSHNKFAISKLENYLLFCITIKETCRTLVLFHIDP
jgi:hypothetical protein